MYICVKVISFVNNKCVYEIKYAYFSVLKIRSISLLIKSALFYYQIWYGTDKWYIPVQNIQNILIYCVEVTMKCIVIWLIMIVFSYSVVGM